MARTPRLQLDRFVPYRLSVLSNLTGTAIAAGYAERFALGIPEWRVVAALAERPDTSAAEVAARTAMDKVAVSRAVARLLRTRRIVRTRSRDDRRRSMLRLSRTGRAMYAQVVPYAFACEAALLAVLDTAERAALDRLLAKLTRRAHELAPCIIARLAQQARRRRSPSGSGASS